MNNWTRTTTAVLAIGLAGILSTTAWAGSPWMVPGDFPTISAAITGANPGDTIIVAAGTYVENLTLNKNLTILGAKAGVDARGRVLGAPNPATESIIAPSSGTGILLQTGCAGSTIDGFAIVGGIRGIESNTGPLNNLMIRNNHIEGQTGSAMFMNDSAIDMTIHQNVMIGSTASSTVLHFDTDTFEGLHITANNVLRTGTPASNGWFVDGNRNVKPSVNRTPLISQNVFRNHTTGSNIGTRALLQATISDNTWDANASDGLQGGPKDTLITNNRFINNGGNGLALTSFGNMGADRGAQNCTVTNNQILNNAYIVASRAGVLCSSTQAPGTISTNHINNNFIIGNLVGALYTGAEVIDMENNWWGNSSGPSDPIGTNPTAGCTAGSPYVGDLVNISGTGDPIGPTSTGLDYCPWNTSIGALTLTTTSPSCAGSMGTLTVTLNVTGLERAAAGGEFFLSFNTAALNFASANPGTLDFTSELYEVVNEAGGTIDYAVIIPPGNPASTTDQTMATFTFTIVQNVCNASNMVSFRTHVPPTRLSNIWGQPLNMVLNNLGAITIDTTPPVLTCPPNVTVECDPSDPNALPGSLLGSAVGGVEIEYNTGQPETPLQQAYLKAQLSHTNTNGMHLTFSTALLPPYNIPGLSWATLFGQVSPSQFGFDMVLPAPTWGGNPLIPFLNAYDNVNNNCPNATATPNFIWALNDYNALGGPTVNNCVINSLFRSAGLAPNAVTITKNIVTLSGTVYTAKIGGILQSDNLIHWFNPATPDSPVSNFLLNGKIYFDATLTYDSLGDPGNDGDFYAGTITLSFNSPFTGANAVGVPTVTDNCTAQPLVTFSDVVTPGSCPQEKTIVRTWTAVDACGNSSQCVQNITVQDSMPPEITYCPPNIVVNADAGSCTAVVNVGQALAQDCCDPMITVVGTRSDFMPLNAPYPTGPTTITWSATDDCGNSSNCMQTVTVNNVTVMMVDIDLIGGYVGTNFTRCIRFELHRCGFPGPVIVDANVNFVNGSATNVAINVPCGLYDCITARDRKHTLRRTADAGNFGMNLNQYFADFTGPDALIGGNLNDDAFVDILDYGAFAGAYLTNYGTANTLCGLLGLNADISGDGLVFDEDFTFIQINFLVFREANCCGLLSIAGNEEVPGIDDGAGHANLFRSGDRPTTSISVKELKRLGLHDYAQGDLNHDGMLDVNDVAAFANGARP